jgi:hypothetical protein
VLVTSAVVVALCAAGVGVVALASSGSDGGSTVGAPASRGSTTLAPTAPAAACAGAPPRELAIPAGFGTAVAVPSSTQQITRWASEQTTIEQRWPADADAAAKLGSTPEPGDSIDSKADQHAVVDGKGVAHRTIVFTFGSQPAGCENLQVSVSGTTAAAVDSVAGALITAPFRSDEPLVATTDAAASAPAVIACDGASKGATTDLAVPVVASIGGPVAQAVFPQPVDALGDFLTGQRTLAPAGYQELRLDDASVAYVKTEHGNVVTTVHVLPTKGGWTVSDWWASGC